MTGFYSFQFATDLAAVFGQVTQVIRPGGSVVVAVWGRPEECESAATVNTISRLVPDLRPGARGPFALSAPGVVEVALSQAGLCPTGGGAVACPYTYPDLGAAVAAGRPAARPPGRSSTSAQRPCARPSSTRCRPIRCRMAAIGSTTSFAT